MNYDIVLILVVLLAITNLLLSCALDDSNISLISID